MFFLPLITSLLNTGNNCDCADKILNYLENEKYTWVPRKMNKEQAESAKQQYEEIKKAIDDNPFFSSLTKEVKGFRYYRDIYFEKVEKKNNEKKF